ncbi:arginase family protein [Kitasatospora indigofera]|uniref:arginase family protein n=1 Tax=Kitasatospora indigofera TaxID=67307 RepID=UPI0033B094ED
MPRDLVLVGAPTSAGSYAPGQEAAPRVLRDLGLVDRLRAAGRQVRDAGDGPLQVWAPDPAHPRAQNLAAAVLAVRTVTEQVAAALEQDADILLIGGNCTIALGVMDALLRHDPDAGLLYIDRHFDLNTPVSSIDGALDWMGLAHGLDLPGAAEQLAAAFHRRPLLTPGQLYLLGTDPSGSTAWEREQARLLSLRWVSGADLASAPDSAVAGALGALPPGALAVHIDVDVLDFTDAPLAESTDGRNSGPSLQAIAGVLDTAFHDPRARVLSIGELNPARAAGHPAILPRFLASVTDALRSTAPPA